MERWEDYEELDRHLRQTLSAIGKRYGIFWFVMTGMCFGARYLYRPPESFTAVLLSGTVAWGFLFVALPVYWTVSSIYKLYDTRYGGATGRMVNHRLLAGLNVLAVIYSLVGLALSWGVWVPVAICPALSLYTCAVLGRTDG